MTKGVQHPPIPEDFVAFAGRLADIGRGMLGGAAPTGLMLKPDRTFVTALDAAIEVELRRLIGETYPAHGILGEEHGPERTDAEWVWVLDPIDGTAPFIAGVPVYGTLVALAHRGHPVIGVIDLPVTAERWLGVRGRPTLHNGTPVRTRACADLGTAILTASNPDFFTDAERPALDALRGRTAWRIYGGCCLSYGLLASGRTDVAIDTRLQVYDYAPFPPIIEGAGGVVSDWDGNQLTLASGRQVLCAGDPARHREALGLVRGALA